MLRFILYLFAFAASVFLLATAIRYGLKGAARWDERIIRKRGSAFTGFDWFYRIPFAVGVVPEYYFFMVLGGENYFKSNWWALKTSAFLSFLVFLAFLTNKSEAESYYAWQTISESGILTYVTSGITFWYLNLINLLFVAVFVLIIVESIRMHGWYAPVRIVFYTVLSFLMFSLTIFVMMLIIMVTFLYIAYKIIKFLMTSRRRRRQEVYDPNDVSDKLNTRFRVFRAELYEWEAGRQEVRTARRKDRKPGAKRKRPKIKRKPKHWPKSKNDDIPRFHPD